MLRGKQRIQEKLRSHKELRYVISGVASEAIEYLSFFAFIGTTHLLVVSNSISFILGIASGFVFHKLWSFAGEQQFKTHQQLVGYALLAAFNFTMTNVLISWFVHGLRLWPGLAKLLVMAITAAWSYLIFNKFIFRHSR